jgi:DNA-binding MarR family transcriptional regulator
VTPVPATHPGPTGAAPPQGGPADELFAVVAGLRRVARRRLRGSMPGPRLQGAQLELLQLVEAEPGTGVAAAARALHLAGNSVSTLVNQLMRNGLLHREIDPVDRRAARLLLTDQARDRLSTWRRARSRLVGAAFDRLPTPDQDSLTEALPALRRLLHELEEAG